MEAFFYIIGIFVIGAIYVVIDHYRLKRIATNRGEANICQYARTFDYREVDTRIMREVWNELQVCLGDFKGKPFPIESEDIFKETYNMDHDDLDEIYWSVADKLGISTDNPENNPYFNQVTSVKNLVLFLHNQPKVQNA